MSRCRAMTITRLLGNRHVETVEDNGHGAVESDEIDQFGNAVTPERALRLIVKELGHDSSGYERRSEIIRHRLLFAKHRWLLSGHDGGDHFIRQPARLADQNMSVEFITGMEVRTGHKDCDLAHALWQLRIARHGFGVVPDRPSELRKSQPGIPGSDQRAAVIDRLETLETCLDALLHIVIKGAL